MIWTIFVILVILWVLGLVSSYTMGGFIHIFARSGSHCAGTRPLSREMTVANDLQILISVVSFINGAIE